MKSRIVFIRGFEEFKRSHRPHEVFIAHSFFGGDAHKMADYRLAFSDGLPEKNYRPAFADDSSGFLLDTICQNIIDTDASIFDLTGYNANVLIEFGMSLALNQPTLAIAKADDKPLLDFLEELTPLRYTSSASLARKIGETLHDRTQRFLQHGIEPRFCVACQKDCLSRNPFPAIGNEFAIIGVDPLIDEELHHQIIKTLDPFGLTEVSLSNANLTVCQWIHRFQRVKLALFHSKANGKAHHGEENAAVMVQLGMAVGMGVPWRMILLPSDEPPTDLKGYKWVVFDENQFTVFRNSLSGTVKNLILEKRPSQGIYDPLPQSSEEIFDEEEIQLSELNVLGKLSGVPPLPTGFIAHQEQLNALHEYLTSTQRNAGIIALTGLGGIGKTTLATAICHNPETSQFFKGGIYWFYAPQYIEAQSLRNLFRPTDMSPLVSDFSLVPFLVVLDEVDSVPNTLVNTFADDIMEFSAEFPNSIFLLTSRSATGLLELIDAQSFPMQVLSEEEALNLLSASKAIPDFEMERAKRIIAKLNYFPMAIKLASQQLSSGTSYEDLELKLNTDNNSRTIPVTIEIAVNSLKEEQKQRLIDLALQPEGTRFSFNEIANFWQARANLSRSDTITYLHELSKRGLLISESDDTKFVLSEVRDFVFKTIIVDPEVLLDEAISLFKKDHGNRAAARDLVIRAVDIDERNERAWLWLSALVDSIEDQQVCLENVLTINPNNERAQKALNELQIRLKEVFEPYNQIRQLALSGNKKAAFKALKAFTEQHPEYDPDNLASDLALKVFVSSTNLDLAAYRNAARKICTSLGFLPIMMEDFEAMGVGATEASRQKLTEADLFVGILAHGYGYIETGYAASVTELEYDYASELGLGRLCFFADPDYDWPAEYIDAENQSHLASFKQKIDNQVIRATFTTVEDFEAKLLRSLRAWLESE